MQDYVTVFDLLRAGFRDPFFLPGLFFICVTGWLLRNRNQIGRPGRSKTIVLVIMFGFSVLWTLTNVAFSYHEYQSLCRAMREGRVSVVEGPVENFVPMSNANKETESFTVRGVPFWYSPSWITPGFRKGSTHGGPIRAGLLVRITYVGPVSDGPVIVRLEIHR